jgi:hypothetical protein
MIDIIIRDAGYGEWLPIIKVTDTGKELYRGAREQSQEEALAAARESWDESLTGNIIEFKRENGL